MTSRMLITNNNANPDNLVIPQIVQEFISEVSLKHNPKFEIRDKTKPTGFMKFISFFVLLFNKKFNTSYITTINGAIWVPPGFFNSHPMNSLEVIAHETLHEYDRLRLSTPVFILLYMSPQILALLSLLSLLAIWFSPMWLLCLLFLLLASPIPSLGRMYLELRGYRTNMLFVRYVDNVPESNLNFHADYMVEQFTGPFYYFMWPFKTHMRKLLLKEPDIKTGFYKELLDWLEQKNLLVKKPV